MKKLFWTSLIVLGLTTSVYAAETKKVCHEKKDKTGKIVQDCKQVKQHKKLETETKPAK
jgi:hypothetical protein